MGQKRTLEEMDKLNFKLILLGYTVLYETILGVEAVLHLVDNNITYRVIHYRERAEHILIETTDGNEALEIYYEAKALIKNNTN